MLRKQMPYAIDDQRHHRPDHPRYNCDNYGSSPRPPRLLPADLRGYPFGSLQQRWVVLTLWINPGSSNEIDAGLFVVIFTTPPG